MKPHLTTTPDGEIVYDPPHEHHTVRRNGELAWCCSTRGTPAGRIGPLTRIPAGVGHKREAERIKRLIRAKSKSFPQTSPSGPSAGGKMVGAGITEGASADSLTPQSGGTSSVPRLQTPSSQSAPVVPAATAPVKGVYPPSQMANRPVAALNGADPTPSSKSMNGPSGKTANNAESETATKETGSLADLVASGERVVGAREVTTSYGRTCILEGASGKEYWGTALLLSQLEEMPTLLDGGGDIVLEVRSANGRTYRTFSKGIKVKGRRFGKGAA